MSPRISLAYAPIWENDIVLRAASGIYYQSPFYKELGTTEGEIKNAMQTANTRQAIQLGAMAGSMSSICLMASEGVIVPGEGPMTVDTLNDISTMLLTKARSEFDDTFIQYHKAGVNLGINECNKILDEQLDYR